MLRYHFVVVVEAILEVGGGDGEVAEDLESLGEEGQVVDVDDDLEQREHFLDRGVGVLLLDEILQVLLGVADLPQPHQLLRILCGESLVDLSELVGSLEVLGIGRKNKY